MSAHTSNGDDGLDALDIPTVCRRAGVGRSFVYEEIRAGRLIAHKYGRLTRVLNADYRRWLDGAPAIEPSKPSGAIDHNGGPPLNDAVNKTSNARRRGGDR
jgi:excisionase family DNA binding protein